MIYPFIGCAFAEKRKARCKYTASVKKIRSLTAGAAAPDKLN